MRELRLYVSIFTFFSLCIIVSLISLFTDTSSKDSDEMMEKEERGVNRASVFSQLDYFVLRENQRVLQLNADELLQTYEQKQKVIKFFDPKGIAYSSNGLPVHYKGDKGNFHFGDNTLSLKDNVTINTENSFLSADEVNYFLSKEEIHGLGNIDTKSHIEKTEDKVFVKSDEVLFYPQKEVSVFKNNVDGKVKRSKKYEEDIDFKSQILTLNMPINKIDLEEDVYVKKGQLDTWAKKRGNLS